MPRSADQTALDRPRRAARRRAISPPDLAWTGSSAADRRRVWRRSFLALTAAGLVWRVARYAANPSIWGDEAFIADNVLSRDYAGLLRPLDYFQIAPVGFLWVERALSSAMGASEPVLRLVPFLAGIASLLLLARFALQAVDRRSAMVAVGIFAASFYPVRHATEIKPYSTDLLLSMMVTGLAWSTWRDRASTARWLALAGCVSVGVWFSYPLIFVAAGAGLVLGVRVLRPVSPRAAALWALFGLATSASWLAGYLLVARSQAAAAPFYDSNHLWAIAFPPLSEPWRLPLWLVDVHTGNMLAYPIGGNNFASVATALLVAVGCLTLRRTRPALLALLLSPLLPTFVAAALHRYPYGTSARVSLYMAPAFCLLAGVGFVRLVRRYLAGPRRARAFAIATASLIAMAAVPAVLNVVMPYKNFEDAENRRAVRDLAALSVAGDRWLVFDGLRGESPRYDAVCEHWLQQLAEVRYNLMARSPGSLRWIAETDEITPHDGGRTWLIVHRAGNPEFHEASFRSCLDRMTAALGPPKLHPRELTRGESLDAYEFPGRGGSAVRRP